MRRFKPLCLSGALLLLPAVAMAAEPTPPQHPANPAETLKEAVRLLDEGRFKQAAETFQRADDQAGGTCGPCLLGLSRAYVGLEKFEDSADTARRAAGKLKSPDLVSQAWNQVGMALTRKQKPDLAGAEEAFRKAAGLGGKLALVSRYNLADVLWREKKFAESEEAARQVLNADPAGPAAKNARIVLCQAKIDGAPPPSPEELFADEEVESCGMMPPPPGSEEPKTLKDDPAVQRPEKIFGAPPYYSEQARVDKAEGTVLLDSIIDDEGCIQKLRVCRRAHHPDLNRSALEAVRRWVFRPAMLEGQPVKVYYTLTVNFQVGEHPGPG
jgi:TonB family protein